MDALPQSEIAPRLFVQVMAPLNRRCREMICTKSIRRPERSEGPPDAC